MISVKKQKLLNIAFSCLDDNECYLEIGTYLGKSLISAMLQNPTRKVYACDNFSEFTPSNSFEKLQNNLHEYKLDRNVIFYNSDFLEILNKNKIPFPVGVYFYDGAHDENNQYLAIKNIESLLSNNATVIIDDWRFAEDSKSYAKDAHSNCL
ncbi:MAG: class I SAM-dependent methyltransferase [Actinobacteria bacterium]|nr:class I SAM-dependent methyltransferase [Actinomycetota bacterium]